MDLSAKFNTREKANKGSFLHLKHPGTGAYLYDETDGKEDRSKRVGIWFLGKDSDQFNKIQHQKVNAAISGKKSQRTSEEIEQEAIDLVASLATGWENITHGGKKEFSIELLSDLMHKEKWVKEQSDLFIGDRANFI